MKLIYDGEVIGTITTNRSLNLEECFDLLNIDIDEMDDGDSKWDYELFEMDYEDVKQEIANRTAVSQAARSLGKLGGSAKTAAKSTASRANGKLGGRPRKAKEE